MPSQEGFRVICSRLILLHESLASISSLKVNILLRSLGVLAIGLPLVTTAEVKLGNEVLASNGCKALKGKQVGLITNPSGVNRNLDTTIEVLRAAPGVKLDRKSVGGGRRGELG